MKKFLWIFLLLLLIGAGSYMAYKMFFTRSVSTEALSLVPEDAVFIVETDEPVLAWRTLSKSPMWNHIKHYEPLGDIGKMADELTETIDDNDLIFSAFGSRNVLISAHVIKKDDYDFLYVCDMKSGAKFDIVKDGIIKLLKNNGYSYTPENVGSIVMHHFFDPKDRSTLHLFFFDNQLVCSFNDELIRRSLADQAKPKLAKDQRFTEIMQESQGGGLCKIYLNHARMGDFLQVYMDDVSGMRKVFSSMHYTGASADIEDDLITFRGITNINDSMPSHLRALARSGKSKTGFDRILSNKTAFVMSMGFQSFGKFHENLKEVMKEDKAGWAEYQKNKKLVEKLMNISVDDDMMGWIDDEIALARYEQTRVIGGKVNNIIAVKALSAEKAKEKLDLIEKKFRRRTPMKFKVEKYGDYEIHHMGMKGLFRLFFGKVFDKIEKPYFTIIEDYVVFSDDAATLLRTIDDYEAGNTLEKDEAYNKFKSNFSAESSMFSYLNLKKYFLDLKEILNRESWQKSYTNRQYIMCFPQIGFQLSENGMKFDTRLFAEFYKPTEDDSLEIREDHARDIDEILDEDSMSGADAFILEFLNENVRSEQYDNGNVKFRAETRDGELHGRYVEYWENGKMKVSGKYTAGRRTGKWKFFDEQGELVRKQRYRRRGGDDNDSDTSSNIQ